MKYSPAAVVLLLKKLPLKMLLTLLTLTLLLPPYSELLSASPSELQAILSRPYCETGLPAVEGFDVFGGDWSADENEILSAPAGSGPKLVWKNYQITETITRIYVDVKVAPRQAGNAGIITHVSDCGVGADSFNGYEFALYDNDQTAIIGRHRQNFTLLQKVKCTVIPDHWMTIGICAKASDGQTELELYLSDQPKVLDQPEDRTECPTMTAPDGKRLTLVARFTDTDLRLTSGRIGFRPWQRTAAYRNLWIAGERIPLRKTPGNRINPYPETLAADNLPPIGLVCRQPRTQPYAVGLDFWQAQPKGPGCALKIIYPAEPNRPVDTIFNSPSGAIYDANITPDAKYLYFSYRPECSENRWNIYRIKIDGSDLTQITSGPFHDVSPCPLPDGGLIFVSDRRPGHTVCQPGPSSNLFRIERDGTNIRCISMNTLSDFNPQLLPDGRVLFTRWEYIDRDLTYRQSLWTQNPDGTGYQLYFGNTVRNTGSFLQSRPIPGRSDAVLSVFTSHHGYPHGAIGRIDRAFGPETPLNQGYRYLTKDLGENIADRSTEWSYRDPFPLSETRFLCSFGSEETDVNTSVRSTRYRIWLCDSSSRKRLIYEDPHSEMGCYNPMAITAQPVCQPAELLDGSAPEDAPDSQWGTVLLSDVYNGLAPFVQPGRVKTIRILEQVRKSEDLNQRAFDQSPVASYGTYYVKRLWGDVPVQPDGSAYFKVPALREVYLQALDDQGRELQRMTSAMQIMPGQQLGCIGCHESRTSAPVNLSNRAMPLAAAKEAAVPQMPAWFEDLRPISRWPDARILSYTTLVQPVLDRYCVECHSGPAPEAGYDLTGDKTRFFSMSYDNLLGRSRSYRQHDMFTGRMLDSERAKGKPMVHFYWLLFTPSGINAPLEAGTFASRLTDIIQQPHAQRPIMPLKDRQRIYTWLDSNVIYYNTYANSRPNSAGKRDLFTDPQTGNLSSWFTEDFLPVYNRRCSSCHQAFESNETITANSNTTTNWEGRFAWINLSRPELSAALTAHLPRPLGRGIAVSQPEENQKTYVFNTPEDEDYQTLLRAFRKGHENMMSVPRADMPGFQSGKAEP